MRNRCFSIAAAIFLALMPPVLAQDVVPNTQVVSSCGSVTYPAGVNRPDTQDTSGKKCVNATVAASVSGFPTVQTTGTPISATTGGVTGTLPSGTVVVASNVGATNGVYCKLGASATTSDQLIPPNSWFAFTVGSNTQLTCITPTGTTTVNMVGGSGLATGSGGGGGGSGGGGAVTNAGTFAVQNTAATPAGTNIIGKLGIDQTTPGTTNGVYVTNNGVAQGTATSGQTPSTIACNTLTAVPTAYTTATTNVPSCDAYGNQVVQPYSLSTSLVQGTTAAMTGTTSTSLVAAPGSGLRNYVTNLTCVNSHATVGTFVTVQDGSGGTALYTLAAAPVFGGSSIVFPAPLRQPTANTALYVADVTTGANVICSAAGYKAP